MPGPLVTTVTPVECPVAVCDSHLNSEGRSCSISLCGQGLAWGHPRASDPAMSAACVSRSVQLTAALLQNAGDIEDPELGGNPKDAEGQPLASLDRPRGVSELSCHLSALLPSHPHREGPLKSAGSHGSFSPGAGSPVLRSAGTRFAYCSAQFCMLLPPCPGGSET